jgi:hypothetical protein
MKAACAVLLSLALPAGAQVKVTQSPDRISVEIDGKPFTALFVGPEVAKPYFYPLRAASGTSVTRRFPLEEGPGDSKDHPQHRGLTFAHADVNGYNFWANEAFNPGPKGKIVLRNVVRAQGGAKTGDIEAVLRWLDPQGKPLLSDTRKMTFYSHPSLRIIDFDILLKAIERSKFGDTHEGSFGVRVAAWLEEPAPNYVPRAEGGQARPVEPKRTGKITDAAGHVTEAEVRGKRANWADYSGEFQGEKLGIAILDHPGNPRHPTYWHARGYGMFAANIFGVSDFENDTSRDGSMTLEPAQELRFRYRVVIHPGDAVSAGIAKMYADYTK